jgi:hypothetical protein
MLPPPRATEPIACGKKRGLLNGNTDPLSALLAKYRVAPASFKLLSNFDLAVLQRSSFENSWNTTVGRSRHSALSFVAAGLTE